MWPFNGKMSSARATNVPAFILRVMGRLSKHYIFEIKKEKTGCYKTEFEKIVLNSVIKHHTRMFTSPRSRPKKET